jgi:hypothetical protein
LPLCLFSVGFVLSEVLIDPLYFFLLALYFICSDCPLNTEDTRPSEKRQRGNQNRDNTSPTEKRQRGNHNTDNTRPTEKRQRFFLLALYCLCSDCPFVFFLLALYCLCSETEKRQWGNQNIRKYKGQQKTDKGAIRTSENTRPTETRQRGNQNTDNTSPTEKKTMGQSEHRQYKANRKKTKGFLIAPLSVFCWPLYFLMF